MMKQPAGGTATGNSKPHKKADDEDKIYDVDGYWLRAACVCVTDAREDQVLLVSSSARPQNWIVPGGKVKSQEAPEASAEREALEEAGVVGRLGRCLGVFDNTDRKHRTRVYVLTVDKLLDDYEDSGRRKRRWFPVEEAKQHLISYKPLHCKYIAAMRQSSKDAEKDGSSSSKGANGLDGGGDRGVGSRGGER